MADEWITKAIQPRSRIMLGMLPQVSDQKIKLGVLVNKKIENDCVSLLIINYEIL
jgi:hypothetical protein